MINKRQGRLARERSSWKQPTNYIVTFW